MWTKKLKGGHKKVGIKRRALQGRASKGQVSKGQAVKGRWEMSGIRIGQGYRTAIGS